MKVIPEAAHRIVIEDGDTVDRLYEELGNYTGDCTVRLDVENREFVIVGTRYEDFS
jgi:hypothetical protein